MKRGENAGDSIPYSRGTSVKLPPHLGKTRWVTIAVHLRALVYKGAPGTDGLLSPRKRAWVKGPSSEDAGRTLVFVFATSGLLPCLFNKNIASLLTSVFPRPLFDYGVLPETPERRDVHTRILLGPLHTTVRTTKLTRMSACFQQPRRPLSTSNADLSWTVRPPVRSLK